MVSFYFRPFHDWLDSDLDAKHAKSISGELKRLSNSVREGKKPLYILSIVVLLSALREGIESCYFLIATTFWL